MVRDKHDKMKGAWGRFDKPVKLERPSIDAYIDDSLR